jgi:hypothetical protein
MVFVEVLVQALVVIQLVQHNVQQLVPASVVQLVQEILVEVIV